MGIIYPRSAFVGVEFSINFCFFGHHFGSRYARNSINGSEDTGKILDSKKSLKQKMARWVGAQGQANSVKKRKNTPILDVTKREPKTEIFFQSKLEDLPNP